MRSKNKLYLLSDTTNWQVEERPLLCPEGQRSGLGLTMHDEETAEEKSKRTLEKGTHEGQRELCQR